jgi:hypothetical protein
MNPRIQSRLACDAFYRGGHTATNSADEASELLLSVNLNPFSLIKLLKCLASERLQQGQLLAILARLLPVLLIRSTRPAVYAMGILAAYWCFERMAVWLA